MLMDVVRIIYNKGMTAKSLGHLHERNACIEILQNIVLSSGVYSIHSHSLSKDQILDILEIKRLIESLLSSQGL